MIYSLQSLELPSMSCASINDELRNFRSTQSLELPSISRTSFREELEKLQDRHFNTLFEIEIDSETPIIRCSDCPQYTFSTTYEFGQHLDSKDHRARLKGRVRLALNLYKNMRHWYGFTGLHIPTVGINPCTPVPEIRCELCPNWVHKVVHGDEVPSLLAVGKAHLKSSDHPIEYDEEKAREYMVQQPFLLLRFNSITRADNACLPQRRNSPGCLSTKQAKLLERFRKQHPGCSLELEARGEPAALIHCRDCHVYIHIHSVKEADLSTTMNKVEAHFATTRHKRLAGMRVERERKRKRYEELRSNDVARKR
jgi:hypothetical protein